MFQSNSKTADTLRQVLVLLAAIATIWAFTAIINKQSATTALVTVSALLVVLVGSILFRMRRSQTLVPGRA